MKSPKFETCTFICVTDLVPKHWRPWFFEMLSSDAPFSWGDNNRTLITVERFIDHVQDCFDMRKGDEAMPSDRAVKRYIKGLCGLSAGIYIDLEN